jgi:glutathione S-transferase
MFVLYGFPFSHNTRKVLAAAHATETQLDLRLIDLVAKQSFTPEFKAINPNGLTPVLIDGEFTLWESNAILVHLACRDPQRRMWPADPHKHMDILRWLFWQSCHWDPGLDVISIETMVRQLEGRGPADPVEVARGRMLVAKSAPVLDAHLAQRPYVCGDAVTIADFALASSMSYQHVVDLGLHDYAHIQRWYDQLWQNPSWRATEPEWAGLGLAASGPGVRFRS